MGSEGSRPRSSAGDYEEVLLGKDLEEAGAVLELAEVATAGGEKRGAVFEFGLKFTNLGLGAGGGAEFVEEEPAGKKENDN